MRMTWKEKAMYGALLWIACLCGMYFLHVVIGLLGINSFFSLF